LLGHRHPAADTPCRARTPALQVPSEVHPDRVRPGPIPATSESRPYCLMPRMTSHCARAKCHALTALPPVFLRGSRHPRLGYRSGHLAMHPSTVPRLLSYLPRLPPREWARLRLGGEADAASSASHASMVPATGIVPLDRRHPHSPVRLLPPPPAPQIHPWLTLARE
jgi:hypothetical protein